MSKFHLTIKENENNEIIKEYDFDAMFAGVANDEDGGYIEVVEATPIRCSMAISDARIGIKKFLKEHPSCATFIKLAETMAGFVNTESGRTQDEQQ